MSIAEQALIEKIKAQPGFTVAPYRNGGGVIIINERANGVTQSGVWLGKSGTLERLRSFVNNQDNISGENHEQ